MTPAILDFLREGQVVSDIGPTTQLSVLKMNTSGMINGSLVLLLFLNDATTPRYALRLPRHPGRAEQLEANFSALKTLEKMPELRGRVPEPVFAGEVDGIFFTLETCLDGVSMAIEMRPFDNNGDEAGFAEMLALACDWLWKLHSATWNGFDTTLNVTLDEDLSLLHTAGNLTDDEAEILHNLNAILSSSRIERAFCHHDFNLHNVLIALPERKLGVVDWELATFDFALFDLFHLVTFVYLFQGNLLASLEKRLPALWSEQNPTGKVFLMALDRYAQRVGLSARDYSPLFSLYLIRLAGIMLRDPRQAPDSKFPLLIQLALQFAQQEDRRLAIR